MHSIEWCRDVDWGTAPQWVTAAIALLALLVSAIGIGTTVRAYRASVKNTREAQARLVYGQLVRASFYKKGRNAIEVQREVGTASLQYGIRLFDDDMNLITQTEEARAYFTLGVVNNSKEIIGEVLIGVVDGASGKPEGPARTFVDAVDPEARYEYTIGVIDTRWFGSYSLIPWVEFVDSGGTKWRRVGTRPISRVKPNRPWRRKDVFVV